MAIVKCPQCGLSFDWEKEKDWEKLGRRYWHKQCVNIATNDKNSNIWIEKTFEILSKDLKVSYIYFQCKEQIDKVIKKYNFTKKGIYLTTKYYLLVKEFKWNPEFGFWFLPNYYDMARQFEEAKYNDEKLTQIEQESKLKESYVPKKKRIEYTSIKKQNKIPTLADVFKEEED